MNVKILRDGAIVPKRQTKGSSGVDLHVLIDSDVTLHPNTPTLLPTGLSFEVPWGHEIQIRPRSGLACKYGVTVVNSPGTVDSDYRGEIKVGLINLGKEDFIIKNGDRVAQAVLCPVVFTHLNVVDNLTDTERGDKGFGSTGTK